jgi:hypothetical protein
MSIFESNIPPLLRFFHGDFSSGWIDVPDEDEISQMEARSSEEEQLSHCRLANFGHFPVSLLCLKRRREPLEDPEL